MQPSKHQVCVSDGFRVTLSNVKNVYPFFSGLFTQPKAVCYLLTLTLNFALFSVEETPAGAPQWPGWHPGGEGLWAEPGHPRHVAQPQYLRFPAHRMKGLDKIHTIILCSGQ